MFHMLLSKAKHNENEYKSMIWSRNHTKVSMKIAKKQKNCLILEKGEIYLSMIELNMFVEGD